MSARDVIASRWASLDADGQPDYSRLFREEWKAAAAAGANGRKLGSRKVFVVPADAGYRILAPGQIESLEVEWTRPDALCLKAGEMTTQELRTAQAVVRGFAAALRSLGDGK